jgi:hypothetical protein
MSKEINSQEDAEVLQKNLDHLADYVKDYPLVIRSFEFHIYKVLPNFLHFGGEEEEFFFLMFLSRGANIISF